MKAPEQIGMRTSSCPLGVALRKRRAITGPLTHGVTVRSAPGHLDCGPAGTLGTWWLVRQLDNGGWEGIPSGCRDFLTGLRLVATFGHNSGQGYQPSWDLYLEACYPSVAETPSMANRDTEGEQLRSVYGDAQAESGAGGDRSDGH